MTRRTRETGTGKDSLRQRIATALLYERLGLEGDWRDPEFHISLPESLPTLSGRKLSSTDAREIDSSLHRLSVLGCHERVLYWCLSQIGGEAEDARQGKKRVVILHEDEGKNQERVISRAMATRQDMVVLVNKVRAAERAVRKYRDELLLVASCDDPIDLPSGFLTGPEIPEESMLVLLSSLSWVRRLASAWQSPNSTALMKSKGLLFLLVYVWLRTATESGRGQKQRRTGTKQATPYRIPNDAAQELAEIVHMYRRISFTAGDLNDKLQDFAVNERIVFDGLVALLEALDRTASNSASM